MLRATLVCVRYARRTLLLPEPRRSPYRIMSSLFSSDPNKTAAPCVSEQCDVECAADDDAQSEMTDVDGENDDDTVDFSSDVNAAGSQKATAARVLTPEQIASLSERAMSTSSGAMRLFDPRIGVTVLTGFLGSGKTTLLNYILTSPAHGKKIAVIENEFGEVGIDNALVIHEDEQLVEMNNGCICCTVRGDLIKILGRLHDRHKLAVKKANSTGAVPNTVSGYIDFVLIETTGMADPGPVAQTFFVDDGIAAKYRLEGIVTVIDSYHFQQQMLQSREVKEQIGFADLILLNKTDLISAEDTDQVEKAVRAINAVAHIHRTVRGVMPVDILLSIGGFNVRRALEYKPEFFALEYPFEWGALYRLDAGEYAVHMKNGTDESCNLVMLRVFVGANDEVDPSKLNSKIETEYARAALMLFSADKAQSKSVAANESITVGRHKTVLQLDLTAPMKYPFKLGKATWVIVYTEHQCASEYDFTIRVDSTSEEACTTIEPRAAHVFKSNHTHDQTVSSVGIEMNEAVNEKRLNDWMGRLLREDGNNIYRMKGVLNIHGWNKRYVFHSVHMLFNGQEDRMWRPDEDKKSILIIIGKELDRQKLTAEFYKCAQKAIL